MALLKGMSGDLEGQVFELTDTETTIGRHESNKIPINHLSISSFHCCVDKDGEKYTLRDLDSTNGTRVEGQKIKLRRLVNGNVVQFGGLEFVFEGGSANAEDETPATARVKKPELSAGIAKSPTTSGTRADFKNANGFKGKMLWIGIGIAAFLGIVGAIVLFIKLSRLG
jgi:pSer/pThr/pTyr-binding forkhead associated (FHA) protein